MTASTAPRVHDRGRRPLLGASDWALAAIVVAGVALRCWELGAHLFQFDEAFTAMAARRPFPDLLQFLRHHDSHPPLDYLIRAPLARTGSLLALRLPSVVFSIAALVVFARWMRARGWVGVLATALMAVSGFQIFFGREARMYALMELIGVVAAILLERWLRDPRPLHAPAVGCLVFVGAMNHVTMLFLALGLLAAPRARRDRDAWRWRAGIAAGLAAWAVTWGPALLDQSRARAGAWIPPTSPDSFVNGVGRVVTFSSGQELLALGLLAAGAVALWRWDRELGRVGLYCAVVPTLALAAVGIWMPVMIERSLTFASWAAPLVLAALVGEAARRWRPLAVVAAVTVGTLVVPSGIAMLRGDWEVDRLTRRLSAQVSTGDVVATRPAWWAPLTEWGVGVASGGPIERVTVPGLSQTAAFRLGSRHSGRIWVVQRGRIASDLLGASRCAPDWHDELFHVACLVVR